MKKILFVDDDRSVLEGFRRLLYPLREEWKMSFAASGREALEVLAREPFDVIITDVRMPGMDGTELLVKVRELYPEIVRIILSGLSEREFTLKSAATAHQYFSKPIEPDALRAAIARARALKTSFEDPSLQALVSGIRSLPSVPSLYRQLIEELERPDSGVEDVARVIERDVAMTAKVLQLANSAFFGVPRRIGSPKAAVIYLGMDTIKGLALSVNVFSQFRSSSQLFSIGELTHHSMLTGMLARKIAKEEGAPRRVVEDAFMAGLLHKVGILILANAFPKQYDEALELAKRSGVGLWRAEQQIFGASHAEIGSYLLWLWGMPDSVVEAVAYLHAPSRCPVAAFGPLAATHAACALEEARERLPPGQAGEIPENIDRAYLERLSLLERLPGWRAFANDTLLIQEAA